MSEVTTTIIDEELNEGDLLLDALQNENLYNGKKPSSIWFDFYNQQDDTDLAKYLVTLVIIYGKYKLTTSEEEAYKLRRLPGDLWKKGFKLPKTFEQIEYVIQSVARALKIQYAGSTKNDSYEQIEVELFVDFINYPENAICIHITNKYDGSTYTINLDEAISTSPNNIRAILSAYADSIKGAKKYLKYDIPNAVSQAQSLKNYRPRYNRN